MGKTRADRCVFEAARLGNLARLKELVEGRVDVNAKDEDGYTAMMVAAQHGHAEVVRFLAGGCRADVNARDIWSHRAVHGDVVGRRSLGSASGGKLRR